MKSTSCKLENCCPKIEYDIEEFKYDIKDHIFLSDIYLALNKFEKVPANLVLQKFQFAY